MQLTRVGIGVLAARLCLAVLAAAGLLSLGLLHRNDLRLHAQAAAPPAWATSAFKITFGLKRKFPNTSWNGAIRNPAQVRSLAGWHLDTSDAIVPPNRWDITLRPAGRDIAEKGIIVNLISPEPQPVTLSTRAGDFTFTPAAIPYGSPYLVPGLADDVFIERVPAPHRVGSPEDEDDDPALLRARDGAYWMAWVAYRTRERSGYTIRGADQVRVARSRDGQFWSEPVAITPPGDHFRVALGEDAQGRIWCIYGLQKQPESGNFDLYARSFDGKQWSAEQQLTRRPLPDIFHRVATDAGGNLYLVWMAYRNCSQGGSPQSDILMRVLGAQGWTEEKLVTDSCEDDWEPSVAVGPDRRAWIAWDAYRARGEAPATYDVMLRGYENGQFSPARAVSETTLAEMRADVAVDAASRVWVAWEEGGANWGKDTGYENPKHRIRLRKGGSLIYGPNDSPTALYRRPRVAVLEHGQLRQPAAHIEDAFPDHLRRNLLQNPRLATDGAGRIWAILRHQWIARGRNAGHLFDLYATTLAGEGAGQKWMWAVPLPGSTGRQDTVSASAPEAGGGLVLAVVGDGRRLPVGLAENHDIAVLLLRDEAPVAAAPALAAFQPSPAETPPPTHPKEAAAVARLRGHRIQSGGRAYKIVRGDLHRHTEISMDGAIDGSLWDLYRYAINAAAFDFIAVTDHNYGAWLDTDEPEARNTDDIYQWWRTQKSADLFHVPGRFVPLYGYERSINFPLGHNNIFHVRRGFFSYRVPKLHIIERPDLVDRDAQGLWAYLRSTDGIGIPHTSATSMGTDWRLRDDAVQPVTEIYQGDRNSYEDEGQPRAATPDSIGDGSAGRQPFQRGLIWNALGVGYKMGFIASSDHFSTHISYANLLVPDRMTTREDIQQAFRLRHTYGSTDNIVVEFSAGGVLQGEEMEAGQSPVFQVRVIGTEPILRVDVIKNNRVIYAQRGAAGAAPGNELAFSFRDVAEFGGDFADTSMGTTSQIKNWDNPETGIRARPPGEESYYYVRVLQSSSSAQPEAEGEIAWSSPIYVRRKTQ